MIHLIYGEDSVGVEEALAELMGSAGPDDLRDVNTTRFQDDRLTPEQVAAAAFTVPFMAERRVVVVKGLLGRFERRRARGRSNGQGDDALGGWSQFADQLQTMPPTTELAFADGGLSRSNPLLRKLAPIAQVREFQLPRDREMPGWITRRASAIGVEIDLRASAVLADAVGRQPRLIDSELRKLALRANGGAITVEDVREMVAYVREANIFQAVDAVIDGRSAVALRLVRRVMEDGNPASYILTMLARQVRLLLLAKDLGSRGVSREEIGGRLRLSGWVLNKTLQQERRISFERLRYVHDRLVETDLALKTKPIEDQLAIEILIAELCTG